MTTVLRMAGRAFSYLSAYGSVARFFSSANARPALLADELGRAKRLVELRLGKCIKV
jgi:hypothetical protein